MSKNFQWSLANVIVCIGLNWIEFKEELICFFLYSIKLLSIEKRPISFMFGEDPNEKVWDLFAFPETCSPLAEQIEVKYSGFGRVSPTLTMLIFFLVSAWLPSESVFIPILQGMPADLRRIVLRAFPLSKDFDMFINLFEGKAEVFRLVEVKLDYKPRFGVQWCFSLFHVKCNLAVGANSLADDSVEPRIQALELHLLIPAEVSSLGSEAEHFEDEQVWVFLLLLQLLKALVFAL